MINWHETTLGEACELYQPKTISATEMVDDGDYPVYGANGIVGRYDKFNHEEPQLLITCRGATCGTVNVSLPNSWINGNAMVVKPRDSSIKLNYLEHLFRGGVDLTAAITGAAQPQITRQSLAPLKFRVPPLSEQIRIAAILDQAAALGFKRNEALTQIDRLTQAIFIGMFGDPVDNPNKYPVSNLIDLVDAKRPISYGILMPGPDVEGGVKYIRVVDMKYGGIELSGIRRTTEAISNSFKRSLLKPGDLLMSIRGHVGRLAVIPQELEGANITQDSARLAIIGANAMYVRECLRTPGIQRWMAKHTKGVAVRGINLGDVKLMPIPLPPPSLQNEFARRALAIDKLVGEYKEALTGFDALFASLQHRAFRGKL